MSEGDWLQDTIPVDLLFYMDAKGRKCLLVEDADIEEFKKQVAEQRGIWDKQRLDLLEGVDENPDDESAEKQVLIEKQAAEISKMMDTAESEILRLEKEHVDRLADPIVETYHFLPYSYFERMEAEEKFTKVDPETQESVRQEDRIRDALLVSTLKGVSKKNKDGVVETTALSQKLVRRFSSPVATRLWKHIREWSEPSEAETFRIRYGAL